MIAADLAAQLGLHRSDRDEWRRQRALDEFRRAVGDRYWVGRIVEAIAGIEDGDTVFADFRDAVEGDAKRLDIPDDRASLVASSALEQHTLRAQEIAEKLRRELHFYQTGAEDAVARRFCEKAGLGLAPQLCEATLALHFGPDAARERVERWRALLAMLSSRRAAA